MSTPNTNKDTNDHEDDRDSFVPSSFDYNPPSTQQIHSHLASVFDAVESMDRQELDGLVHEATLIDSDIAALRPAADLVLPHAHEPPRAVELLEAERGSAALPDRTCPELILPGDSSFQVPSVDRVPDDPTKAPAASLPSRAVGIHHTATLNARVSKPELDPALPTEDTALRDRVWAHSANDKMIRQGLDEHSPSTASLAREFASVFGAGGLAYAAGLLHDAGKARRAWQDGLSRVEGTDERVGVPHKDLGARLLATVPGDRHAAWAAALMVWGHHGGLPSSTELRQMLRQPGEADDGEAVERFLEAVPQARAVLDGPLLLPESWRKRQGVRELGVRLTYSALVDADFLDTAVHFLRRAQPTLGAGIGMAELRDRFERRRLDYLTVRRAEAEERGRKSSMHDLREELYTAAVAAATGKPGVYRMSAPTGTGKTIAGAGFALHHAAEHGKSRVIVAVPYTSITEQNADVFRRLLDLRPVDADSDSVDGGDGDDADADGGRIVLEHHSHVDLGDEDRATPAGARRERWQRLASENWDAPFVVTTTVQLLDSLFARKPSRMRKLHRLANAVLVLDEVQALPKALLLPILDALRALSEHFGTTVLLTSATQPVFESLSPWHGLAVPEIVPDPVRMAAQARRVEFRWWSRPTLAELAEQVRQRHRALVVLNTVDDARRLFGMVSGRTEGRVVHLSTRMHPDHRRAALKTIEDTLTGDGPLLVVSTQLIEAGVDVDFPVVYRAMAPVDSLLQAAGRANREGGEIPGEVVVVDLADGGRPGDYGPAIAVSGYYFGADKSQPDDLQALARYYPHLYKALELDAPPVTEHRKLPRGQLVQYHRRNWDFPAVADGPLVALADSVRRDPRRAFRMIDQDDLPVVISAGGDSDRIGRLLRQARYVPQARFAALRRLQRWTVMLPRRIADTDAVRVKLRPVVGDLHEWLGPYHVDLGLDETAVT
ncbi:CRISPR-associated helicase Cas3' [Actinosynnema sp. CS-041913]|uniref:CRISPR-associated helicase Cas3' n=1 Tax=Actinosynnema sp. CS-041913 TaxID=3239917 RepID=UPI003D930780